MKKLFIIIILFPLFSFSQSWIWARRGGAVNNDIGKAICIDGIRNCYIAIDSSDLAIVVKYKSSGLFVWTKSLWTGSVKTIIYDGGNFIYAAGDASNNTIIAKIDTSGNLIWKITGGVGKCNGISLDKNSSLYLTGETAFLQKYDTSGNLLWILNGNAIGNSICTDSLSNCYITGKFSGSASFGGNNFSALGTQDIFVTKYDSSGNCIWAKRIGGNFNCCYSNDCGYAITKDNAGNIYFTGSMVDTVNFDSFTFIASENDVFLAKYDTSGNALWVRQAAGWSDQEARCIAINNQDIFISGSYVPNLNFDGYTLTGWGNYDAFVAKYDINGTFIHAIKAGGPSWNEYVNGICIDNSGNAYTAGSFSYTAYVGIDTLISSGGYDFFVGKIDFAVDIEEINNNNFIANIFPNPTNNTLTIETGENTTITEIHIADIFGRVVSKFQPINQTSFNIDLLNSGTFFVTIFDNSDRMVTQKLIVIK